MSKSFAPGGKRRWFIAAALALFAARADASQILYEGFDYTAGANLENQVNNSVVGGAQDWDRAGVTTINTPVGSGTLTNPYVSQPAATGNKVIIGAAATRAERLNFPAVSGGTIYYSLLLNVTDLTAQYNTTNGTANDTGAFLFGFNNGNADTGTSTAPSVVGTRIQIRRDPSEATLASGATRYNIAVLNQGTATAADFNDTTQYLTNHTYFIVGSYTFNNAFTNQADDVARIWINPDPATFDPNVTIPNDTFTGGDLATPGAQAIIVRNTGGLPTASEIDEIYVGTDYTDVVPEPTGFALTAIGAMAGLIRRRRA